MATEDPGFTTTATGSTTQKRGIQITNNTAASIVSITKFNDCTATKGYVCADSSDTIGADISSATFSGNTATFASPVSVSASTKYWLVCDDNGNSYTHSVDADSVSYPITMTYTTANGGWNGGFATDQGPNVDTFEVNVPVNDSFNATALTLSLTAQAPTYTASITLTALALSLSLGSPTYAIVSHGQPTTVSVGTGQATSRYLKTYWPIEEGLTMGTTKLHGRSGKLTPVKSLVPQKDKVLL